MCDLNSLIVDEVEPYPFPHFLMQQYESNCVYIASTVYTKQLLYAILQDVNNTGSEALKRIMQAT